MLFKEGRIDGDARKRQAAKRKRKRKAASSAISRRCGPRFARLSGPRDKTTINLTVIVLGVTAAMSASLGLIDWLFAKLFALIIG